MKKSLSAIGLCLSLFFIDSNPLQASWCCCKRDRDNAEQEMTQTIARPVVESKLLEIDAFNPYISDANQKFLGYCDQPSVSPTKVATTMKSQVGYKNVTDASKQVGHIMASSTNSFGINLPPQSFDPIDLTVGFTKPQSQEIALELGSSKLPLPYLRLPDGQEWPFEDPIVKTKIQGNMTSETTYYQVMHARGNGKAYIRASETYTVTFPPAAWSDRRYGVSFTRVNFQDLKNEINPSLAISSKTDSLAFLAELVDQKAKYLNSHPVKFRADSDKEMDAPMFDSDTNELLSLQDYDKCRTMMSASKNLVRLVISEVAADKNLNLEQTLKKTAPWHAGFVSFPFNFFNYSKSESDKYYDEQFSIDANPNIVGTILSTSSSPALVDSILKILRESEEEVAKYQGTDREFTYFGLVNLYRENPAGIQTRLIQFNLNLKKTDVTSLCGGFQKTTLSTNYKNNLFNGNKLTMIKTYDYMDDKTPFDIAAYLVEYLKDNKPDQYKSFKQEISDTL